MLAAWNQAVAPDDELYHLGDFAVRHPDPSRLLDQLHGRKHLLTGNNDPPAIIGLAGWSSVQPYLELVVDGVALVLCHYALRTWNSMSRDALNLHGHSHGRLKPLLRQYDVGVDAGGFRPVSLVQLKPLRLIN